MIDNNGENCEIDVHQLARLQQHPHNLLLVDVREQHERDIVSLGGQHIPVAQIMKKLHQIDFSKQVVIYCHHGVRSLAVARQLRAAGKPNVFSLKGGIDAWRQEIDPTMVRY